MEIENYYIKNQETDKLNIFTSKEYYDSLEESKRKLFKQFCLWSNGSNVEYLKEKPISVTV